MNIPGSENNSKKINQNESSNPSFYSSQTKKPIIHFGNINPNLLNINCIPKINQSFNIMNEFNISQNTKNNDSDINTNINPNQNQSENSKSNLAFHNKSIQQEKYDAIKIFCTKKNDSNNYPLISYENFLLIDNLCDQNSTTNEIYTNFLLNKNASIELYSKFCTLLINRYIFSRQNNPSINKYPKVVYQIIFDIDNIYNFLSKDIVADAKESNMFMLLVFSQNMWNVAIFNNKNKTGVYFMLNKSIKREKIFELMNIINKEVYPEKEFKFSVSDYSGFSNGNKTVLPFIILDFYSRYNNNLPHDDEDYYYQTILILSEILTNNLITK